MTQTQPNSSVIEAGKKDPNLAKATYGRATLMATRQESRSIITLSQLQEQFRQLCITGMRGADAIAKFREDPKGNLGVVRDCTAEMNEGLAELRQDLERAKIALPSGEKIFCWEYEALGEIARSARLLFKEILERIKVKNGSVVHLSLSNSKIEDLGLVAGLTSLQNLFLHDTSVRDIAPLAALSSLQQLWLYNTSVEDLSPLSVD